MQHISSLKGVSPSASEVEEWGMAAKDEVATPRCFIHRRSLLVGIFAGFLFACILVFAAGNFNYVDLHSSLYSPLLLDSDEDPTTMHLSLQSSHQQTQLNSSQPWDFLLLVQQWPGSFCLLEDASHKCAIPAHVSYWTLHGLWPNENNGQYPSNCDNKNHFELKDVAPIHDQLLAYWANLLAGATASSFWAHEWEKHGTCAMSLPLLGSQLKFFNETLGARTRYDFSSAFARAGVVPSNTQVYSSSIMKDAIKKSFGVEPLLACGHPKPAHLRPHAPLLDASEDEISASSSSSSKPEKKSSGMVLAEMALCLDKTLTAIDCPPSVASMGIGHPCGDQQDILYPVIVH